MFYTIARVARSFDSVLKRYLIVYDCGTFSNNSSMELENQYWTQTERSKSSKVKAFKRWLPWKSICSRNWKQNNICLQCKNIPPPLPPVEIWLSHISATLANVFIGNDSLGFLLPVNRDISRSGVFIVCLHME